MGKLQRELKILERNVQRVRTKLQHVLTLTPSTNAADYNINNSSINMTIIQ